MVIGTRFTKAALIHRFAMPGETADALARLAAHRVDLTEEVARAAASDADLARLLASPELRAAARSLTTDKLQALRKTLRARGRAAELVVEPRRSWRTIAFDDERSALPMLIPASVRAPMRADEVAALFPDDEVKRLKLTVLTSAEPKSRITAIRQLVLAPGTPRDKGAVLVSALGDNDPEVRLEAVKALVPLGLNPDVAREARLLVSGSDRHKAGAAARVVDLAAQSGPGEVSVLLSLVAATLRGDVPDDVRRPLLESLAKAAPVLARDPAQLRGAVALVAEQLTDRPLELARSAHTVLTALAAEQPDATVGALDAEAGRVRDPAARRVLLGAFAALSVPEARRRQLAELMAAELLTAPEPETQCLGIANALCRWGEAAAEVLLDHVDRALKQQKTFILRILDELASRRDCPARTKTAVAEKFLTLMKTEPPAARAALLECEILSDNALPDQLKSALAAELIGHVHEFGGPRMIGLIENTIARLGPPAIPPLVKVLTGGVRERERVSAARVLGELVGHLPGRGRRAADAVVNVLMAGVRLLDRDFPDRNVLAASIGQMCTSRAMPPDTVRRVARGLRARVGKEPYSFGLLEGLGHLAASPNVALATRVDVAEELLRLLDVDLPEMQSKRFTGGEKTIFIAGSQAAAYTDMVPILLDGLRNVCVHAGSTTLQDRLIESLLDKWRRASTWKLIWGPANTLKLADVLGEIALAPNSTPEARFEIAAALATGADLLPVLRVLGPLFAADSASAAMGALAARVGSHLLERLAPRSGDRIDRDAVVMSSLAAIAARRNLGPADKADWLRSSVAGVLFKALRNETPGAKQALRTLADSPALTHKLRTEIESRLAQT